MRWYRNTVRRVLETLDPKRLESADSESKRLDTLENSFSQEVPVCFLGAGGIGKSTVINALVGESLLPHGGIGPLPHKRCRFDMGSNRDGYIDPLGVEFADSF